MAEGGKFCFKPNSIQIAKWTVYLQHGISATLAKVVPKRSPKRHPPKCLGLNEVGACCCPSCRGQARSCRGWGKWGNLRSPLTSQKGEGQGMFPPELLKFLWLDPHRLSLRKWLDRENISQCRNSFLYTTHSFTGSFWGNSALSPSLWFESVSLHHEVQAVSDNQLHN